MGFTRHFRFNLLTDHERLIRKKAAVTVEPVIKPYFACWGFTCVISGDLFGVVKTRWELDEFTDQTGFVTMSMDKPWLIMLNCTFKLCRAIAA